MGNKHNVYTEHTGLPIQCIGRCKHAENTTHKQYAYKLHTQACMLCTLYIYMQQMCTHAVGTQCTKHRPTADTHVPHKRRLYTCHIVRLKNAYTERQTDTHATGHKRACTHRRSVCLHEYARQRPCMWTLACLARMRLTIVF